MNPDPFTLRQLAWMAEGRGEFLWNMTASEMALQINMNRKKGAKAVSPSELNPYSSKRKAKVMLSVRDSMEALKKAFLGK